MKYLASIVSALVMACGTVAAQDYNLNSHNLVPFSLNPAQAGNANAIRLSADVRQQWPTLGNNYKTARVSYDQNFYKRMCSLGAYYAFDDQASGIYRSNEFSLIYSHTFEVTERAFVRLGLQGAYFLNFSGLDALQFGDQYDESNGKVDPTSIEDAGHDSQGLFDFSVGATFNVENVFSVGAAVYHLAEPENGFVDKANNTLHRKFVAHANYMHDLLYGNGLWGRRDLSDTYFFVNANYQRQADFQKAYLGLGLYLSPVMLGLAEKSNLDEVHVTSFQLGFSYKAFQAYYIFDLPTYKWENGSWSHELCLIYVIKKNEKFPCPMVYW